MTIGYSQQIRGRHGGNGFAFDIVFLWIEGYFAAVWLWKKSNLKRVIRVWGRELWWTLTLVSSFLKLFLLREVIKLTSLKWNLIYLVDIIIHMFWTIQSMGSILYSPDNLSSCTGLAHMLNKKSEWMWQRPVFSKKQLEFGSVSQIIT